MTNQSDLQHSSPKVFDLSQKKEDNNYDDSAVSTSAMDSSSIHSSPSRESLRQKNSQHETRNKSSQKKKKSGGFCAAEQEIYNTHADQIRQNAIQLLKTEISPSTNRYRSYHDGPATFASSDSASLPPWVANSNAQTSHGVGNDLSVSQVASMAFTCISHCLMEGYRAASNYYSTYEQQEGKSDHTYCNVGSGEVDTGYYQDNVSVCQNEHMDRGLQSMSSGNHSSGHFIGEMHPQQPEVRVKGEYSTVLLPSTYQGGNNASISK